MTSSGRADSRPTFRVLGPLSVWDGETYQPLAASKPASMLATLLTSPNEVVSNDFLLRAVWGDEAEVEAKPALRTCTTRLRKLLVRHNLGDDLIQTVSGGYRLMAGVDELDLLLFRERVVSSTRLDSAAAQVSALRGALELWQGSLLCNVDSDVLHRGVVPLVEEERLQVLERIVDQLVSGGLDSEALAELQALTRSHEGHERFALQLVGVLYRAGRREDALAECTRIKQYLADELGLDPTPELTAAEMAILTGESLGGPGAGTSDRIDRAEDAERTEDPGDTTPTGTVHQLRPTPSGRPAAPAAAQPPLPDPGLPALAGSSGFVGRQEETDRLVQQLRSDPGSRAVCLLIGPPGVGKSSIALHTAARIAARTSDDPAPRTAGQALVRMRDAADLPRPLTDVLAEISAGGRPAGLLLLDDAAHEEDVAAIADAFPDRSILVTTGTPMLSLVRTHGALVHRVGPLAMADALALLGRLLGTNAVAEDMLAAYEIVSLCWRNPLALRVLAATLATRPSWGLSTAASWLGEDPVARLSDGSGALSLAAYADRAMRRLGDPLAQLVTELAALDLEDFSLGDVCDRLPGKCDAHLDLSDLVDRGWLDELAPGRYRVDPFVRAFVGRAGASARSPGHRLGADQPGRPPSPTPLRPDLHPIGAAGPTRLQMPQEGAR